MSSINQEFLPSYRIQSFGKICRYAPYFLIKDYTYRSIWRNSMHQMLRRFSRIFTEIFQESSENIPRIFFFFFFFPEVNLFYFFFRVLKLKVFMLSWIRRKVYALFLRNINIVLSSDLNALKIVNYSRD